MFLAGINYWSNFQSGRSKRIALVCVDCVIVRLLKDIHTDLPSITFMYVDFLQSIFVNMHSKHVQIVCVEVKQIVENRR